MKFGMVRDEFDKQVQMTKGRYQVFLRSADRRVRQDAYQAFNLAYDTHRHLLASLYGASVRKEVFLAKAQSFPSARKRYLFVHNIPEAIHNETLAAVRAGQPIMQRYLALRQSVLGIAELTPWDLDVPLAPMVKRDWSYRDATQLLLTALRPLGEQYVNDLRTAFATRWVDVHETVGKRSGAYAFGTYRAPPRILLNWAGSIDDVLALAHETGHAMHRLYADANQPYHAATYSPIVGEAVALVNEQMVLRHLLNTSGSDEQSTRLPMLGLMVENMVNTIFGQAVLAEFEDRAHRMVEQGEPLTAATLSDLYIEVLAAYMPGLKTVAATRIEWASVPHLYRSLHVFEYILGQVAAVTLVRRLRNEGSGAVRRYHDLLAAGGSNYPLELLRQSGVDFMHGKPIEAAVSDIEEMVSEFFVLL